ncbi:MAG: hypothetical protein U1F34_05075 [Gammaproteobacteria bacterium]
MSGAHGVQGEGDGRLIFYSIPSGILASACPTIEEIVKQSYQGKVECRTGTLG